MSPDAAQVEALLAQCGHARYVWNLGHEQRAAYRPGRGPTPGYHEQARQLTEARAEHAWLAAGSQIVQQQALRDLDQAWRNFFNGTHRRPGFRRQGVHEGFRIVGPAASRVRQDNGRWSSVLVPKVGWVRFRRSRTVARARRGSNRRGRIKGQIARLKAREADRRKDWVEKTSTDLTRRYDMIRVEDLNIQGMTRSARGTVDNPGRNVAQKAGLNRGILANGWGLLVRRLEQKAPGRVERVPAAYTSQRCSACGHTAPGNRESQAVFRCVACGHTAHADTNAACNIAAGRAVTARGGTVLAGPVNREPQQHELLFG
ncbi:Probable transposase [Parafrankia irregularis]|uniref:Probable transposase n=1 Tax=Parafrankia irregularis TaxID=795642 RepID=A0A0S4QWA5_9ACTN|nr:Probable transposase [Parafrankia irregularis]